MKRTTVFADEGDLAVLKAAAARRGVAEAELLRNAIHLAAMAHRTWDEPFFARTYTSSAGIHSTDDVAPATWDDKAESYRQTKHRAR